LDVIEYAIRGGASIISVTIEEQAERDLLQIRVEDNGSGLSSAVESCEGTTSDLVLNLFQAAVEESGGDLRLGRSDLGGRSICAEIGLSHVDRQPLGDLAATLSSVVCTNPDLDLWCHFRTSRGECAVRVSDIAREFRVNERCGLAIARRLSERLRNGLAAIGG